MSKYGFNKIVIIICGEKRKITENQILKSSFYVVCSIFILLLRESDGGALYFEWIPLV